ncbi:scavenger receptor cysteine-rich type 1 protein M130 isoform X1 [Epinephelus lanceolatus]|uniref:antigen WC1.1 n=1 Tax=Epinephelus lanceolatus TaxID=310571 RepID=UPI0014471EF2|nr:antigen WC1.1 [Epinephelus lanceolatus]
MMWFLLLLLYAAQVELVITQGEKRLCLRGTNPCEGHIEVYFNGERGFVGHQSWNNVTEKVVCKSTYCGDRENSSLETVLWAIEKVWLNNLVCNEDSKNLWDCKYPGWGTSLYQMGDLRKIRCSNKIKLRLDGDHCAGVVEYSTDDGKTWSGFFCDDGWGDQEATLLCKNTNCGEATSKKPQLKSDVLGRFKNSTKMKVECSGIKDPNHLWQCVTGKSSNCQKPASVICKDYERLQLEGNTSSSVCSGQLQRENDKGDWESVKESKISADKWCKQMHCGVKNASNTDDNGIQLECSDKVKVLLMDNNQESKCYGEVYVQVNNERQPVCASSWKDKDAEVVCRELKCGKLISKEKKIPDRPIQGIMDNVTCSGKESSLWHCEAKHDNNLKCSSTAYVVCADSVKVNLTDGPGRCAGRVEIQHKGQWKRVYKNQWTDINSNVVCKEMGCGEKRKHENFFQGSSEFLAKTVECNENNKNISECFTDKSNPGGREDAEAMGIICTEHKVVILEGDAACSGKVKIVQDKETYWLSGSDETWNSKSADTVCQQMHCGTARDFSSIKSPGVDNTTSKLKSYSCSSPKASLFDCEEKVPLPSNHNDTIAFVDCSEKIQMTLTNGCWGEVNICVGNKCGGVSADTWTTEKSNLLCKKLACEGRALTAISKPPKSKVIFKSLHMTEETTNLEQCNFVSNDKNNTDYDPAYVVCSGSVESKMDVSRDKCSGNVKVLYEGKLRPVCKDALKDSNTQKTICEELGCGQAGKLIEYFGSKSQETPVISKIECSGDSKSLKTCLTTASKDSCTLGGLQCSSWSKIQLTVANKACSGAVSVVSHGKISPVSIQSWTGEAGNRLCQDLDCGSLKSNKTTTLSSSWATNFSCAGEKDPESIWKCKKETFVLDKGNEKVEQLLIECQDEPKVTLSGRCHGEVMINGREVCSSTWTDTDSQLVCQQECGNAITGAPSLKPRPLLSNMDYYHVSCESNHYKLGNCKRFMGKCDKKVVYVSCTDNNVKFNTTKKCGGQILVTYRGKSEKVCPLTSFPETMKDKLCQSFDCRGHNRNIKRSDNKIKENLETTLSCDGKDIQDINYCVKYKTCNALPAEIYCEGYEEDLPVTESKDNFTVPIILGVVFLLVLVILIVVFLRIYIVRKNKKGKNFSSRMLPRQEVEFESGDYEDVTGKENEMEDLSRGRFLPEVITENDAHSTSSLPYDDIDDMLEAQHLTSQVATSGASGDNYMHEGALDQSEDGVTYEVDDPQENYDDIEAGPEITATEAEIHETPQTAPESATAPPPELVEGDDDYLVPGVDG